MIEKLKQYSKHPSLGILADTRALGLIAFGVIAILVSWSGVKSIQTNYELQKQISELTQQNDVKKLENNNLKLRNEYFKTDQFLELAARRQFGKSAPGETVFIVPKKVALANTVDVQTTKVTEKTSKQTKPFYQKNLESWVNFFFRNK
jgi:cell division protein FtsB